MNVILPTNKHPRTKLLSLLTLLLLCLICIPFLTSCNKKIDYFEYVSELRSNIFLASDEEFSLRIYATVKESPYANDGVPRETFSRTEIFLTAPEGSKTTQITFQIGEQTHSGEMSYDSVKSEYYYAVPLNLSQQTAILCLIKYGEVEKEFTAGSVLTENTLTPKEALSCLEKANAQLFSALTDKYGFAGEICLRLIYEGSPYYYIGIIDRSGKCNAFLMNAETGNILAKRES